MKRNCPPVVCKKKHLKLQTGIIACLSYCLAFIMFLTICGCGLFNRTIIKENFNKNKLNKLLWTVTESGDFSDKTVDIYVNNIADAENKVLRLMAGTKNTSSQTKTLGIRSVEKIDFTEGVALESDLDWNSQENGSYLSAVIMLSPEIIDNMETGSDFISLEYTGVPPGKNIGVSVKQMRNRSLKVIYKDYGPSDESGKRAGRNPDNKIFNIRILIDDERISFFENDKEKLSHLQHSLNFSTGYLYLQMRSGTNYPVREIYFDNISVAAENKRK